MSECVVCRMELKPAPTEDYWMELGGYERGIHYRCLEHVYSAYKNLPVATELHENLTNALREIERLQLQVEELIEAGNEMAYDIEFKGFYSGGLIKWDEALKKQKDNA